MFGLYCRGTPAKAKTYLIAATVVALALSLGAGYYLAHLRGPIAVIVIGVAGAGLIGVQLLFVWRDVMVRAYARLLSTDWSDGARIATFLLVLLALAAGTIGIYGFLIAIG